MLWPSFADYEFFVKNAFDFSVLDPILKNGKPMKGISGGFSRVYPVKVASKTFAMRCWVKDVGNTKNRYEKISAYLKKRRLRYFVDFEYVLKGILVNGTEYPTTRMEWVEGVSLREFIKQNLQSANIFKTVADEFQKMVTILHKHRIAHGDLQDGNILLKKNGSTVEIKLIDYDSLFVPTLRGQPDSIVGLPEYQHPKRIAGGRQANEKIDYFSELVIYLSFLSLSEKPGLWNQFKDKTEKGLLFSRVDFENPDKSDVFQALEKLSPDVQHLAAILKDFCARTSVDRLEPLETILPKPDANIYCNQGESFLNDGRYDEALAVFQKAIDIKPDYARAYFGRGHVYRRTKRYVNAIIAFQQAIKLKSNYKEAHHGLGVAYFESKDNSKAEAAANAALKIDPRYLPARQLLDAIKPSTSTSTSSSSTKSKPRSPTSATSPSPTKPNPKPKPRATNPPSSSTPSQSTMSNPVTNVWRYITKLCLHFLSVLENRWHFVTTGTLGLALIICFIALLIQMNTGNKVHHDEITKLKNQLDQKESKIQRLTSSVQALESHKKELNRENGRLQAELEDTKSVPSTIPSDVVNQLQQLSNQNQLLQEQLVTKDDKIRQLRNDKATAINENQRLKNQIDASNQGTTDQNAVIQQLQREKAKALTENQRLQGQLAAKTSEAKDLTTRTRQLQNEKIGVQRQNQKLQNENEVLMRQNRNLRNESVVLPNQRNKTNPKETNKIVGPEPPKKIQDYRNVGSGAVSHNTQGIIAFNRKNYDKAIGHFRTAIKTNSKFEVAYYNLGCAYFVRKRYYEALAAFNEAVRLNSGFKEAHYNLGLTYFRTKAFAAAKKAVNRALSTDRNYQLAQRLLNTIEGTPR